MTNIDQVRAILREPFQDRHEWHAHGIGMLRTYLEDGVRLNLWHHSMVNPGISSLHTHARAFHSYVVCGQLSNISHEYVEPGEFGAQPWIEDTINCGPAFCGLNGKARTVYLRTGQPHVMRRGDHYRQSTEDIHSTVFHDGTATVMVWEGDPTPNPEAKIFWPLGEQWGDATRTVTATEIMTVCHAALNRLDVSGN